MAAGGTTTVRRGSYGIDAPYLLVVPIVLIVWNVVDGLLHWRILPFVVTTALLASVGCGLYTSRRGKFVVWASLLDSLALRGDERILDLGCGRGAVLLMAADHLTTGRAVGIDLWRAGDQSGNSAEAARQNAAAERVLERVSLHTGDIRSLPFKDYSFDVVLSNVAVHNVKKADRDTVIDEAIRVLRPGGRLMIADIFSVGQYRRRLAARGMINVRQRNLGWRMWWSGPWVSTSVVAATRPPSL